VSVPGCTGGLPVVRVGQYVEKTAEEALGYYYQEELFRRVARGLVKDSDARSSCAFSLRFRGEPWAPRHGRPAVLSPRTGCRRVEVRDATAPHACRGPPKVFVGLPGQGGSPLCAMAHGRAQGR
jgi:hypothetical protein